MLFNGTVSTANVIYRRVSSPFKWCGGVHYIQGRVKLELFLCVKFIPMQVASTLTVMINSCYLMTPFQFQTLFIIE
jgi:hypothetical protein